MNPKIFGKEHLIYVIVSVVITIASACWQNYLLKQKKLKRLLLNECK